MQDVAKVYTGVIVYRDMVKQGSELPRKFINKIYVFGVDYECGGWSSLKVSKNQCMPVVMLMLFPNVN